MAVLEQIKKRYSVRSYQDRPVEKKKLDAVLEAARLAPSAKNFQEWKFVVVQDAGTRKKFVPAANNQVFVGQAPVVIACCAAGDCSYVMRCGQTAYPIDLAIAIDHMTLQAVEEGLGTCWVGSFFEDQVRKILGIPAEVRVVELLVLGYPADQPRHKTRKPVDEIVCREKWS